MICAKILHGGAEYFKGLAQLPLEIRQIWQSSPRLIITIAVLASFAGPMPALSYRLFKMAADQVAMFTSSHNHALYWRLVLTCLFAFFARFVQGCIERVIDFYERKLHLRLVQNVESQVLRHAASLDLSLYHVPEFHDKLQRVQGQLAFRPYSILRAMVGGLQECLVMVGLLAILSSICWWFVPILGIGVLPGFIAEVRHGHLGWVTQRQRTEEERRLRYYGHILSSGREAGEIRLFGLFDRLIGEWRRLSEVFYKQDCMVAQSHCRSAVIGLLAEVTVMLVLYGYIVGMALNSPTVTIGSLVMYHFTMDRTASCMRRLLFSIGGLCDSGRYMKDLVDFLALRSTMASPPVPSAPVPAPIKEGIIIEAISFKYPGASEYVLDNVSFGIAPGEKVGIVGANGAGKTTLAKLLARLYDPTVGRILIDGVDLRDMRPAEWHQHVATMFQDFNRYSATLRENIAFGRAEQMGDEARIVAAAKEAGVDIIAKGLSGGLNTLLGSEFEYGEDLSFGQWQRVALARAIMRDAQLLILDEPSASLDADQEYRLLRSLKTVSRDKTVIVISHRFAAMRLLDRIIVLENGRLVDCGNHKQLLERNGLYAGLYRRQAAGYLHAVNGAGLSRSRGG